MPAILGPTPLLDRTGVSRMMETAYSDPLNAFGELLDEGVALLQRALGSIDRPVDIPDVQVLGVLYRQTLAMLDGFHALISVGAVYASQIPLRSAFEASIYLGWILRDKESRGIQYYVGEKRQRVRSLESLEAGTPRNADLIADAKPKYPELVKTILGEETQELVRAEKERLITHLSESRFRSINESLKALSSEGGAAPWYRALGGPKNLRELSQRAALLAEYDRLYGGMSEITHASTSIGNIHIPTTGSMIVEPLRHVEGLDTNFALATAILLRSLRLVVDEYKPDEMTGFRTRYSERYRERLRMPNIEVTWVTEME